MNENLKHKLEEVLVNDGFIKQEDLDRAKLLMDRNKKTLEEILVLEKMISTDDLGEIIADISGWKAVYLQTENIDKSILKLIPQKMARSKGIIAFAKTDGGIKVAMTDPEDQNLIHLLKKRLCTKIIPYYSTPTDIKDQFRLYEGDIQAEFEKIIKAQSEQAAKGESKESATVLIVDMLLQRGYEGGASDIHIEPLEENTLVRFRIDGVMEDVISIPKTIHDLIISRIKVMARLHTDEHQIPQDGKLRYEDRGEVIDVRVSVVPTTKGENVVMRLLAGKSRQYSLEELGLGARDFEKVKDTIKKPWGMILITGPTGSGKTTSLYGMLKILNRREVNIATIEDPVEYNVDGVTQIQVNAKTSLSFATGLKSIVRQDPDIIMIGEIRDNETAEIAVNSAMTGHLVLSTLHTNDAATSLPRLHDMGIEPFLVASTVNIVIAQRLVRKICPKCITSYETELAELSEKIPLAILEKLARGKESIRLYKGAGCKLCHETGYKGRTGVFEVMEVDNEIRQLIMENVDADTVKAKAIEKGMTTMFDDAREKVLNGETTIDEMLRAVKG